GIGSWASATGGLFFAVISCPFRLVSGAGSPAQTEEGEDRGREPQCSTGGQGHPIRRGRRIDDETDEEGQHDRQQPDQQQGRRASAPAQDRKSTRLNSSHVSISYAVFCLKKKII